MGDLGSERPTRQEQRATEEGRWPEPAGGGWRGLGDDFRFAGRVLRKRPGLTALAILSLALGIGANTAVFSLVDAVLLRTLPYDEPDRVVRLWETFPHPGGRGRGSVSVPDLADWREAARSFSTLEAWDSAAFTVIAGDEPLQLPGAEVSAGLLSMVGVEPLRGRVFAPGEDDPSAPKTVILAEGLWRRVFGADPELLGRDVTVQGEARTVIGILPSGFSFPPRSRVELWIPLVPSESNRQNRGSHWMRVAGRLVPGATVESAQREMEVIVERIAAAYPLTHEDRGIYLQALPETVVGRVRPILLALWGAVALVLLIGCANVANLLLAAATARQREMAVRAAVGAGRWRLVRQMLVESGVLAFLGGALGVGLGLWAVRGLAVLPGTTLPPGSSVELDSTVLSVSAALALAAALLSGLAPALRTARADLQAPLRQGAAAVGHGAGRDRFRSSLVVAEVALSVVVLAGAGLLLKSFLQLKNVPPGLEPEGVLTFRVELPEARYPDGEDAAFFQRLDERLASLPGVTAAGGINLLPLQRWGWNGNFTIEGRTSATAAEEPFSEIRRVTPGYFRSLGIPLLSGRLLGSSDDAEALPVAVVNRTLAERYWPGESPLGRRIAWSDEPEDDDWITVVGVVGDVRNAGLHQEVQGEMYLPLALAPVHQMSFVVRADRDPTALIGEVRQAARELDPEIPLFEIETMEAVISDQIASWSFHALLLGIFAALALILALGGVYGVLAFVVSRRQHEMGLRMALGASRGSVRRLVLGQGLTLATLGVGIGVLLALATSRLLAHQLVEVSPNDPLTFAAVGAILLTVAALASLVPARRATRVEPVVALRQD